MRSDVHNANSGKFGDMDAPVLRDYRREVLRQSDDSNTAITLTVAQSGALVLLDENEAYAITLPAVTINDIGVNYTFLETVASNTDRTINTAYDKIKQFDKITTKDLDNFTENKTLVGIINHEDDTSEEIILIHSYNNFQIEWFKQGSALNVLRSRV